MSKNKIKNKKSGLAITIFFRPNFSYRLNALLVHTPTEFKLPTQTAQLLLFQVEASEFEFLCH